MSAAAVGMAGLALLFVAFGVLAPADGREGGGGCGGGGGDCGSCSGGGTCAADLDLASPAAPEADARSRRTSGSTYEPPPQGGAP